MTARKIQSVVLVSKRRVLRHFHSGAGASGLKCADLHSAIPASARKVNDRLVCCHARLPSAASCLSWNKPAAFTLLGAIQAELQLRSLA